MSALRRTSPAHTKTCKHVRALHAHAHIKHIIRDWCTWEGIRTSLVINEYIMDCGYGNWTLMRHDQVQMQMTANETSTTHPGRLPFLDFLRTCNYAPNKSKLSFTCHTHSAFTSCQGDANDNAGRVCGSGTRSMRTPISGRHSSKENDQRLKAADTEPRTGDGMEVPVGSLTRARIGRRRASQSLPVSLPAPQRLV
jgi:hypothetical protein